MLISRALTHVLLLVFLCMSAVSVCFGNHASSTDVYYPDRIVTSKNGLYRIEAKSPDNAGERPMPFATDFVYTLYDNQSNETLWSRKQDESSPSSVWIHDSGNIVVYNGGLFELEFDSGKKSLTVSIFDQFTRAEHKQYVSQTTAGPMWAGNSIWYFTENSDRLFFVVRTWWDRRIVLNLTDNRLSKSKNADVVEMCDKAEHEYVISALTAACAQLQDTGELERQHSAVRAAHIAGRTGLSDAVPFLRQLESVNHVGTSGGRLDFNNKYGPADINPFARREATLRQHIHLALRKLGEKPTELPCNFFANAPPPDMAQATEPRLSAPRANRTSMLTNGDTPAEVIKAIGEPDYINFRLEAWEYDMDVPGDPYTLRVILDKARRVKELKEIRPPLWQAGNTRYEQLCR